MHLTRKREPPGKLLKTGLFRAFQLVRRVNPSPDRLRVLLKSLTLWYIKEVPCKQNSPADLPGNKIPKPAVSFSEPQRMFRGKKEAAREPNQMVVHRGPLMIKTASSPSMHKEAPFVSLLHCLPRRKFLLQRCPNTSLWFLSAFVLHQILK